jgi:deazaflavin-dependent oxidoreductase (nitroreductase family)
MGGHSDNRLLTGPTFSEVQPIRSVDPMRPRGRGYHALCRFSATKAGGWLSVHILWKVDTRLLKWTRGRLSTAWPVPVGLLESRGARTGEPRRHATIYFHDGDRVIILASNRGAPQHPAWFFNLRRHPDVLFGEAPFRAEIVDDEKERERLWELAGRVYPQFADFRERARQAGRTMPIIRLTTRQVSEP